MRPLRPIKGGKAARPLRTTRAQATPEQQNAERLAELRRQPPIQTPPLTFPHAVEARYQRKLEAIAGQAFDLVRPVIDELWRLQRMADAVQARADAEDDEETPEPEGVVTIAQRGAEREAELRAAKQNKPHTEAQKAQLTLPLSLRSVTLAASRDLELFAAGLPPDLPEPIAREIERHSYKVNLRVFEAVGVQAIDPGTPLDAARKDWLKANNELIVSQPLEVRDRIRTIVDEMVPAGSRWETIAKRLEDEEGIAKRRAALIARDQTGKYFADNNRTRQQAAGFTHYTWLGVRDNRERPEHLALEGTVWSWDKPPIIGNPGEPILCRCSASPCTSEQEIAMAKDISEDELIDRVVELGPTQRMGPDASEAQIRARAVSAVASEIKLARRRA